MAYGTKWTVQVTNGITSQVGKVYIKERDYTDSSTELSAGPSLVTITHQPIGIYASTPHWNIAESTCRVEFVDDGTGLLSEILDGDDEQYQVLFELNSTNEWTGFINPDSYNYSLYGTGISSIDASDRISTLQNLRYASKINESVYTDTANLITNIQRCLDRLSLDIGFEGAMRWYPYLASNPLSETDDPLAKIKINNLVWRDEELNPYSAFFVLEQLCMRFQLRLYQVNNRWHIEQRRKDIYDNSGDVYKVWRYTSAAAADTPATAELTARATVSTTVSGDNQFISPRASGSTPYGSVSVLYFHGAQDNLVGNPGFESAILANGDGGDANWEPNVAASSDADNDGAGNGGGLALKMDGEYLTVAATTFPDDVISTRRVDQTTGNNIAGGSSVRIAFSGEWTWDGLDATFGWGNMWTFVRVKVGTYWVYKDTADGLYKWSTTPTGNSHYIPGVSGSDAGIGWNDITFTTEAMTGVSGELYIELYGVVEDYNGTANAKIAYGRWDNISVTLIGADGTVFNEATRTTITVDGTANKVVPQMPELLIGDGPTNEHKGSLLVTNAAAADVDTVTWAYLITVGDPATSLDELWANQLYREFVASRRMLRSTIHSAASSSPPAPYQNLIVENPNNTLQPDYLWVYSSWRPMNPSRIWSGTWCEFEMGGSGSSKCEADIKPDTTLFRGLELNEGLPCETLSVFSPTEGPTHLYWIETRSGTDYIAKAQITSSPTWSRIELAQIATGRTANHIRVDESSGFIFTIENVTATSDTILVKRNLDGSGATDLINPSSISLTNFDIDRIGKTIMINEDNDPAATGFDVEEYDYSGTFVQQIETETGGQGGWTAYDETGTVTFVRYFNSVGPVDEFRRNGTDILNTALSGSMDEDEVVVDEGFGKAFIHSVAGGKIVSVPLPSGGSESDVITTTIGGEGLGKDRLRQKLYYPSSTLGIIRRANYDGTGAEDVYDDGVVNASIKSIDMGFN